MTSCQNATFQDRTDKKFDILYLSMMYKTFYNLSFNNHCRILAQGRRAKLHHRLHVLAMMFTLFFVSLR